MFEPIESQVRHLPPVEKPLPLSEGGIIGGDHHHHHHHYHHQHHPHHQIHPHHHLSHPIHHGHNWLSIVEHFCCQLMRTTQGLDSVAGSSLPFHWVQIHYITHLLIIHSTSISLGADTLHTIPPHTLFDIHFPWWTFHDMILCWYKSNHDTSNFP